MCRQTCRNIHHPVLFSLILVSLILTGGRDAARAQSTTPTGHENFTVSLPDASTLVRNYRASAPSGAIWGEFFGRDALQSVLNEPGCIGIRTYYGRNNNGTPTLVLVGVDTSGADLTSMRILETGFPCPPVCDTLRVLGH